MGNVSEKLSVGGHKFTVSLEKLFCFFKPIFIVVNLIILSQGQFVGFASRPFLSWAQFGGFPSQN